MLAHPLVTNFPESIKVAPVKKASLTERETIEIIDDDSICNGMNLTLVAGDFC